MLSNLLFLWCPNCILLFTGNHAEDSYRIAIFITESLEKIEIEENN